MAVQQVNGSIKMERAAQYWLAKKAAGEELPAGVRDPTLAESIVGAGDKVLTPAAKFFGTSKANVAGAAAGTATALGYYILSGLWDKKGTHKITRGLAGIGLGLGVGFGTKYGLDKLRPKVHKIQDSLSEIEATPEEYKKHMAERKKISEEADKTIAEQEKELAADAKKQQAEQDKYISLGVGYRNRAEGFRKKNPTVSTPEALARRAELRKEYARLDRVTSADYVKQLNRNYLTARTEEERAAAKAALDQYKLDVAKKHDNIDTYRAANELNPIEQEQEYLSAMPRILGKSQAERKAEANAFLKALGLKEIK